MNISHSYLTGIAMFVMLILPLTLTAHTPGESGEISAAKVSPANGSSAGISSANSLSTSISSSKASSTANVSFEGELFLARYAVSGDARERVSRMKMTVNSDFMLIESAEGSVVDLMGNVRADGIIIRQQNENLVFLTTDDKAVTMNKQELRQLITMLENMRGNSGSQTGLPEVTLTETDESQSIQGYSVRKWIVKAEGRVDEWHVWVTDELAIPWGMLSESWLTRHTFLQGFPVDEWLSDERLPLRAELWNGGRLAEVLEFEDINRRPVDASRFNIPDNYDRINFQQMLFDRMRNR